VISYDIKVQNISTKDKPVTGTLHIMRNRLLLITGTPPTHSILLDYTIASFQNGITLSANEGLVLSEQPHLAILSDQTEDIWRTIQGCKRAVERLRLTPPAARNDRTCLTSSESQADTPCRNSRPTSSQHGARSSKTQYVYYNLPTRPCKYIYMNLPDKRKTPHLSHDYINIFHVGSVYQNCWRSCTERSNEDSTDIEELPPPPPPPRQKPPPLPPKPRNRPPNSPLPPLPLSAQSPPSQPLPRRCDEPPSLPLPRLPDRFVRKEIQYVVYSSKPVMGQIFVIQVVFFQKNDFATLEVSVVGGKQLNFVILWSIYNNQFLEPF
jgi:hypothetical protein